LESHPENIFRDMRENQRHHITLSIPQRIPNGQNASSDFEANNAIRVVVAV
jgi:hypothetical protein